MNRSRALAFPPGSSVPSSFAKSAPRLVLVDRPPTFLASAGAANHDHDPEVTLTVSPEKNKELVERAFAAASEEPELHDGVTYASPVPRPPVACGASERPAPNPWTGAVHHEGVLPEAIVAARTAREAARRAQQAEARRTRWIVLGIWTTAVTLASGLAIALVHA
jgi:hypothetical protein